MKDGDEQLLAEIARRNWVILACLVLLSLPWRSLPVTLGVLGGGLVVITGYHWLHRSLGRLLANPSRGAAKGFKFGYFLRLGVLGAALFLLVGPAGVNPIALAIGLSVVVVNLLWTAVKRVS